MCVSAFNKERERGGSGKRNSVHILTCTYLTVVEF